MDKLNTTLIFGPPGTGKTNSLLNLVDEYLKKGISPEKIGFISFTRKSVSEARDRAAIRFNKNQKWFSYFKTIHALAFRQLGMSTSDVMGRSNYFEIGNLLGLKITGIQQVKTTDISEINKGDQLVFIESLSRLCCKELKQSYDEINPDFSWEELDLYASTLIKYKKSNLLFDFTDMLVEFYNKGYKPNLEVLFVDEAQDLCLLQWKIVEQLAQKSKKIYIAGDDDQAIFRWSGANVEYFIGLTKKCEIKILHQSYRVPKKIYEMARDISTHINNRVKKEFKPTKEKGCIQYVNEVTEINMDLGTWLILVRNVYMIEGVIKQLRLVGYLYESIFDNSKTDNLKAAFLWEKLRNKNLLTIDEVKLVLSLMSKKHCPGSHRNILESKNQNDLVGMEQLVNWFNITCKEKIWHEALDKINVEDREYYIAARRKGESFLKAPRIKISTIHGAKGGEAENVVLHTDMSTRTYNAMVNNYDDEVRVFYVGITRTLKNLYIIQPQTPNYFNLLGV